MSSLGYVLHHTSSVIGGGGRGRKAKKHLRRRRIMPTVPGAHCFNQPHHKNQKERNRNEQRERKKQQPCSPQPLLSPLPSQGVFVCVGGGTSGAQGWVPGRSARQTIEFHFLSTPELRQDVWGHNGRGGARVGIGQGPP